MAVRTAAPLPLFFGMAIEADLGKAGSQALENIAKVPSVEQSSTITSSRSMFSGSGAVSTSEMQRSTTVRSLYTGIRIDSFIGYRSHGSTGAASMPDGSKWLSTNRRQVIHQDHQSTLCVAGNLWRRLGTSRA